MKTSYGEHTALEQRKRRAGQRLIVGLQGTSPSPEFRKFCKVVSPSGFILFARNVEALEQVSELNKELASLVRPEHPPILSVDQEGGRVRRIKESDWPPMRVLGNVNDPRVTKQLIELMSEELRALGFNTNWAPVADVDSNPENPVIGDRSFSSDPSICQEHVLASLEAFQTAGIIGCIKHFPGHGDTSIDSHLDLPTVNKDVDALTRCELLPFRHVHHLVNVIMTAHVMYPAFDQRYPATMSEKILNGVLRKEWGYERLIVSDDLEMKAVRGRWPLDVQLAQASRATVDLFLVCSELDLQWEAFEILIKLQEQEHFHEKQAEKTFERLVDLRRRFFNTEVPQPPLSVVGSAAHADACKWLRSRGGS